MAYILISSHHRIHSDDSMAIKLLLIISVFTVGKYGFAKPSEEASIKLNINVNTDEGVDVEPLHKTILLQKDAGNGKALKGKNRRVSPKYESNAWID